MHLLALLTNPGVFGVLALFLSVLWMLRDERDRTRPLLVFALALNLFFGTLLNFTMAREGALLPFKFDHVLLLMDRSLGISAAAIAAPLQGFWRIPLAAIYLAMVPMMIVWFLVTRYEKSRSAIVAAYVAELIAAPLAYTIVPACGPVYAFKTQWLHPAAVEAAAIRLAGMPNAFPSLHVATAFVLVLFAPRWRWRAVALLFFAGTVLATVSTGEHYAIDLVPGLAFGCFAACIGHKKPRLACWFLAAVLCWSLAVRFLPATLIAHPVLLRAAAMLTVAAAGWAVCQMWSVPAKPIDPQVAAGH